jgi:hypothetical protein
MSSRYAVRRGCWHPRSRYAVITEQSVLQLKIPVDSCWGIRAEPGFALVDRRRLARHIRREVLSIGEAIDDLKATL